MVSEMTLAPCMRAGGASKKGPAGVGARASGTTALWTSSLPLQKLSTNSCVASLKPTFTSSYSTVPASRFISGTRLSDSSVHVSRSGEEYTTNWLW
jgi:hypothetical protein